MTMQLKEINSGIIFTNKNCIGCNKCISDCPVVGANVVVKDKGSQTYGVLVDPNKCILCGTCIDACVHQARTYQDDTDEFFEALKRGEPISILVSPTLLTDYEGQYYNILGYLKECGVKNIYNTGFGADIMIWVYMNFIVYFGLAGVISQTCPVIVNYLEKYRPELLQYLMPVQSPMMCTAIYVRDYLDITDKLAYISPCIASKYEISDVNTYERVTYNVTFERLMERIKDIDITRFYAEDEIGYGLGSLIPTIGGLSDNIKQFIGFDEVMIQTSGPSNIFPYFNHYYYSEVNNNGELPFLVDALSCTDGCNFGTGTNCGYEKRNEMSFSAHRAKENAYKSGNVITASSHRERLEKLNVRFENYDLIGFVRQYGNTRALTKTVLTDQQVEEIYCSMYKYTESQRHTDCGSCGYTTCRDMAEAIGSNFNYKENCINYSKECIRRETEKTDLLLEEISEMNEELKKSSELKSNFLANMSHEIRTPMNAIIGMAEMALRGELPNEEKGYIQQIKASGRTLLTIINDILDFSKIESGKMEINETEYEVMSIINDTVNTVMTRIGEKDITLIVEADPKIPCRLVGDDIRIKQILVNLANNAVKFTESGFVEINLKYKQMEDDIVLTIAIKDSGIGIKTKDKEKLFTSFQQVDSVRNRNIEGTGLGLAISYEFVKLMNGKIKVSSTYGKGSTFSFWIPQKIAKEEPGVRLNNKRKAELAYLIDNEYIKKGFSKAVKQLRVKSTECTSIAELAEIAEGKTRFFFVEYCYWGTKMDEFAKQHPDKQVVVILDPRKDVVSVPYVRKLNQPVYCLNIAAVLNQEKDVGSRDDMQAEAVRFEAPGAKVLIVDDNGINLTVAKGLLSPFHMELFTASGALEALEIIEENQFDIVFMDHMMPEIDGVEATHMIRAKKGDYYQKLPIIALTANAINNAKEMFLREGMSDFVAKPIDMVDITTKLRKWLPADKIRTVNMAGSAPPKKETKELPQIAGVDVEKGLALSGTLELYKIILSDFYVSIEKKAALIEKYEQEENIEAYTIEVHALKSAARLIGATKLADMAAELEKCGHENKVSAIKADTKALTKEYRKLIPILQPYGPVHAAAIKKEVSKEELYQKLDALYQMLDDFDIDGAKMVMDELNSFQLDEQEESQKESLMEAVDNMEYDEAMELVENWKMLS